MGIPHRADQRAQAQLGGLVRELDQYNGVGASWWDQDVWAGGRMLAQELTGASYFLHANTIGSDTQVTNGAGTPLMDMLYYPWGQVWQTAGSTVDSHFAGFQKSAGPIFQTPNRSYLDSVGRWLSPDPLGKKAASPANPQSWNLYAYVTGNPTTLIDESGLQQTDSQFNLPVYNFCYGFSCRRSGSGESEGIAVNGDDIFDAIRGAPGAYTYINQSGNLNFGFSEDLWIHDEAQSEAQFMNSTAYLDAVNAQLASVIAALEGKGVPQKQITAFEKYEGQNFNSLFVNGGNVNFRSTGDGFNFANFGCPNGRCDLGAIGSLDFHHNGGSTFHLDTADPWTSLGGFAKHTWVDVVLGNVGYHVIPRPWSW